MRGRGAAATADDIDAEIAREVLQFFSERFGRFLEDRMAANVFRNTRVRNYRNREPRVLTEITHILSHLLRPRGAIHPDHIDRKWLERGECCAYLSSHQHRAERFDGDLGDHRHAAF